MNMNVVEPNGGRLARPPQHRSALKPGGCAIILLPQDQATYGSLDKVFCQRRRYSEKQLRSRLEEAGFQWEQAPRFNR
jgi:hypothetical protein